MSKLSRKAQRLASKDGHHDLKLKMIGAAAKDTALRNLQERLRAWGVTDADLDDAEQHAASVGMILPTMPKATRRLIAMSVVDHAHQMQETVANG